MLVDLHLHSRASDGTGTPGEIAAEGARRGFGLLALADHNTDRGWEEFAAACTQEGIRPLRGMELDCLYGGWDIHLLAYGYTPGPALARLADHNLGQMNRMSDDLIRKMLEDYPVLSWEDWEQYPHHPARGGWKCLQYLYDRGVTQRLEEGMRFYGQYDCGYGNYPFPAMEEVCGVVRDAGSVPILAHPANWFADLSTAELYRHLDAMRELGVGGIECHYPSHSPQMVRDCRRYCEDHGWLITAGSDWHGEFNKIVHGVCYEIGQVQVDLSQLKLGRCLQQEGEC